MCLGLTNQRQTVICEIVVKRYRPSLTDATYTGDGRLHGTQSGRATRSATDINLADRRRSVYVFWIQ